jgi:hypothetical protein
MPASTDFAFGQVVEDAKFRQLILGRLARTRRRAGHSRKVQRHLSFVGYVVADRALEFRAQRQHGAKDFTQRRQIIIGNPFAQMDKLVIEYRRSIEHAENVLCLHPGRAIMLCSNHARHALLAERHQNSSADHRLHAVRDAVGKRGVQRNGQGDVAEFRHEEGRPLSIG